MYKCINYMIHSYKLHTYNPSQERAHGDLGSPLRVKVMAQSFFSETRDRHVCPLLCPEKKSPDW